MPPAGHEPFLQMVLDDPSDDGPRMVYADWLEERGDPRGEYIRVQLDMARLPEGDPRRERLADRESELYLKHFDIWQAELPEWAWQHVVFRRGFVEEVTIFTEWQRHFGPKLSAIAPIRKVSLSKAHDSLDDFARGPDMRHLQELAILDDRMVPDDVRVLCRSETALVNVKSLLFMGMDLLDSGALMLSLCPHLSGLRRLELKRCELTHRAVSVLSDVAMSRLVSLTALDLSQNDLGNDAIWPLISSPMMERIEHLCWNDNGVTNAAARMLTETADAPLLKHLELAGNIIGDDGAREIMRRFPDLKYLDMSRNSLTLGMVVALKNHYGNRVRVTISA